MKARELSSEGTKVRTKWSWDEMDAFLVGRLIETCFGRDGGSEVEEKGRREFLPLFSREL